MKEDIYKIKIFIYEENSDPVDFSIEGNDLVYIQECARDSLPAICKAYKLDVGELRIEIQISKNGEYFDSDTMIANYDGTKIEPNLEVIGG